LKKFENRQFKLISSRIFEKLVFEQINFLVLDY